MPGRTAGCGSAERTTAGTLPAVTRLRRLSRGFAALAVLVLIAVGCSSDGFPVSYDDQIDAETGLSNVELNWTEGCEPALGENLADKAAQVCACSFSQIKSTIPFESFVELNGELADDPTKFETLIVNGDPIATQVNDIVVGCIAGA